VTVEFDTVMVPVPPFNVPAEFVTDQVKVAVPAVLDTNFRLASAASEFIVCGFAFVNAVAPLYHVPAVVAAGVMTIFVKAP
jgi:hypothetical protein